MLLCDDHAARLARTRIAGWILRHAVVLARVDNERMTDDIVHGSCTDDPIVGDVQRAGPVGTDLEVATVTQVMGTRDRKAMIHHVGIPVPHGGCCVRCAAIRNRVKVHAVRSASSAESVGELRFG
jgi:hypothetical protein